VAKFAFEKGSVAIREGSVAFRHAKMAWEKHYGLSYRAEWEINSLYRFIFIVFVFKCLKPSIGNI
jgi:hypothetical protein